MAESSKITNKLFVWGNVNLNGTQITTYATNQYDVVTGPEAGELVDAEQVNTGIRNNSLVAHGLIEALRKGPDSATRAAGTVTDDTPWDNDLSAIEFNYNLYDSDIDDGFDNKLSIVLRQYLKYSSVFKSVRSNVAGSWETARNFRIADSDGSHTGSSLLISGDATNYTNNNYSLSLPSTIKADLQGIADKADRIKTYEEIPEDNEDFPMGYIDTIDESGYKNLHEIASMTYNPYKQMVKIKKLQAIVQAGNFAICSTEAATVAKTAELSNFELVAGAHVFIYFSNANTADNPTLNINNTGARNIFISNTLYAKGNNFDSWNAGEILELIYRGDTSGGWWTIVGRNNDSKIICGYCTTAAATQIKDVTFKGLVVKTGMHILVNFTYGNTATGPKLKFNGSSDSNAKFIYYHGAQASATLPSMSWSAGDFVELYFDGAYWQIIKPYKVDQARNADSVSNYLNITLNGTAGNFSYNGSSTINRTIYAATNYGNDGTILKAKGQNTAPVWELQQYIGAGKLLKSDGSTYDAGDAYTPVYFTASGTPYPMFYTFRSGYISFTSYNSSEVGETSSKSMSGSWNTWSKAFTGTYMRMGRVLKISLKTENTVTEDHWVRISKDYLIKKCLGSTTSVTAQSLYTVCTITALRDNSDGAPNDYCSYIDGYYVYVSRDQAGGGTSAGFTLEISIYLSSATDK